MNKNKGFIGIGLIIAIVLGAIVIGGGAYYLGKSGSKPVVINPENILPNNENQNLPVVDNSQQVNVVNPTTPTVATGCTSSSVPSIKVLSPNGGETYTAGQKITVKWSSCNSSIDPRVVIILKSTQSPFGSEIATVPDTGSAIITLPTSLGGGSVPLVSGKYYKILTQLGGNAMGYTAPTDLSDNSFTINSPEVLTGNIKIYTTVGGNKIPYDILPNEYVSLQNGSWPLIESSSTQYVCNISNGYGDVPTVIKESIINGRKYCIESTTEGAAGSSYTTYSYKTNNNMGGSIGIKSLNFTLRSANCGVFRDNSTSGGIKYNECQKAQAEIISKLNIIVDSIMFL